MLDWAGVDWWLREGGLEICGGVEVLLDVWEVVLEAEIALGGGRRL